MLFLFHFAATLFMTGVIWVIQIVHYPLFARVGSTGFSAYENAHSLLITPVVIPPMLLELVVAFLLLFNPPKGVPLWSLWFGFGLVVLIWLSTFFLQVPQHAILAKGFDAQAHQFLVQSNWIRTIAWTVRSFLLLWLLTKIS